MNCLCVYGIVSLGVSLTHRVRHVLSGCGWLSVGVACPSVGMVNPQCGWHVYCRCAYVLSLCVYGISRCGSVWHGLSRCGNASVCVAWSQWVWTGLNWCGINSVGVAWCQWVWRGLVCVAWPQWVWHGVSGFSLV